MAILSALPTQRAAVQLASISVEEFLNSLGTSRQGLLAAEAAARLQRFGPNILPRPRRTPWFIQLGRNFVHVMALLLWVGALLAWLAGMPELAVAIVGVVIINGAFSYWQQFRAERAILALEALLPSQVTVRRGGQDLLVATSEVVPGDLLVLREGEAIPADARLLSAVRLRVDASALTGESRPVPRTSDTPMANSRTVPELPNLVLAGQSITSGAGEAVVFATAGQTEFGRLAELTQQLPPRPSPLEIEVHRITRLITLLSVAMGVVFFVIGTSLGGLSLVSAFLFAIGMIVANVPEGLLPTITLSLALGVRRMAARQALVKRLEKVETLGATTLILTDKTGTLTENEMTVREVWTDGASFSLSGAGYDPQGMIRPNGEGASCDAAVQVLRVAALCCDTTLNPPPDERARWQVLGDPTEAALLVAAEKAGITKEILADWPRLDELPFDSVRKRMTTIQRSGTRAVACVKGAPSHVVPRCTRLQTADGDTPFDDACRARVTTAHDALARSGLRVLAVAKRDVDPLAVNGDGWKVHHIEHELTLLGLVAMEDPPRPDVPEAVAACRSAGVRVLMVTGDNGLTASTIGREIGMVGDHVRVVEGRELDTLHDSGLDALLANPDLLFARVTPEHKLRLVEAYQRRDEVVAVTGDGVNDAPALRRADVGVAMGISGTDVAREAADMVLADDHFASIVWAIQEGRAVYDNLRKFATYILASNVPEIVPFVAFVLLRIPLPLTVMQILAVDLGTDLLPALALGAEPPEADVMQRPPRARSARLLDRATLLRAYAWLGAIEAVLCLLGFYIANWLGGWRPGEALVDSGPLYLTATTMSLAGIVACQVGNVFACRSARYSVFTLGWFSNRLLLAGIAAELALVAALIYLPPLARVFGLAPLSPQHFAVLALFPCVLLALEELRKLFVRRRTKFVN